MRRKKYYPGRLEYVIVVALVIAGVLFFTGRERKDVDFCRLMFSRLISGRQSVEKFIDWENLKAVGSDVGEEYRKLPNAEERNKYKKAFIEFFRRGFKEGGGEFKAFTDWRAYKEGNKTVVVAADYRRHKKILLLTVFKGRPRKITALEWEAMDEALE
ncbi:hypothetical protein ACFLZ3_05490 [Candidatus Omnitrophota bacterium]